MQLELRRLASFSEYPNPTNDEDVEMVSILTSARKGFYYDGHSVVCFWCQRKPREHTIDETSDEYPHRRYIKECPEAQEKNEPMAHPEFPVTETDYSLSQDAICVVYRNAYYRASSRGVLFQGERRSRREPYAEGILNYELLKDEAARLLTYEGWPVDAPVQPAALAAAGFFYTGIKDRVRCAFCRGHVETWKHGDDPATEHERHYRDRNCRFLTQRKLHNDTGEVLLKELRTSIVVVPIEGSKRTDFSRSCSAQRLFGSEAIHGKQGTRFLSNASGLLNAVYQVDPREIKARMDSQIVQSIIQMGFPRSLIRQALEVRLRTTGDDYPSAESLLQVVFELQELQEMASLETFSKSRSDEDVVATNLSHMSRPTWARTPDEVRAMPMVLIIKKTSETNAGPSTDSIAIHADIQTKCSTETLDSERIIEQNRQLKEERTCKVCLDHEVNTVFLPCGHLVCCHTCSSMVKRCPVCQTLIRGSVRVFLP